MSKFGDSNYFLEDACDNFENWLQQQSDEGTLDENFQDFIAEVIWAYGEKKKELDKDGDNNERLTQM